ncbi:ribosome biogenesis GTPase [Cerasibacillus quisquiliarum]|uniref:Small ribosomal subunit biogenesis GTPase RsgA n=1 Tax=Cerasibacillus quisquiliarum TaxID=227865 RepID=A0A511UY42_9BACI|nr:ribosome small subunit-dependent GTPase A [Cerasibacillus quisquiliarum]MBB5145812.1 ribosome biogenesis GTPase [Cerasibacillus quisquiliarum]GEN30383.1 putative ribosome biogenesis GTPase RsgA [Cerasibacillus quisquiliarum]
MAEGRIMKALSGFYYVQSGEELYACKGRGLFRKQKITPLVGDFVVFDKSADSEGYIQEIKPRKTELSRPPIANVDQAMIVSSVNMPPFSSLLLDRFLVFIESKQIQPIIVINKVDLADEEELEMIKEYKTIYEKVGYRVLLFSAKQRDDMMDIKTLFQEKITVFAGQSGVGKSSILNAIKPSLTLETAHISKSLGRGRHTTRHVELLNINGGLVADTPGFSVVDFSHISKEELGLCFPEIKTLQHYCKFRGCLHDKEPGCAVKNAVNSKEIATYRYNHYLQFLEEIHLRKPRY